jgi:hypothetical protein
MAKIKGRRRKKARDHSRRPDKEFANLITALTVAPDTRALS